MTMVKSGEVYSSTTIEYDGDFAVGLDSRPRNICNPHGDGYKVLAAV